MQTFLLLFDRKQQIITYNYIYYEGIKFDYQAEVL